MVSTLNVKTDADAEAEFEVAAVVDSEAGSTERSTEKVDSGVYAAKNS